MVGFGERKRIFGKKEKRIEGLVSGILMVFLGLALISNLIDNLNGPKFIFLLISAVFIVLGIYFLFDFFKNTNKKK